MPNRLIWPLLFAMSVAFFSGCGKGIREGVTAAETECKPDAAQIRVGDGFFQRLCGCQEGPGFVSEGNSVTCTVSKNETVFFYFISNYLPHQLVPVGTPAMSATVVVTPHGEEGDSGVTRIWGQHFDSIGTYRFVDQFNARQTGQIVVQ